MRFLCIKRHLHDCSGTGLLAGCIPAPEGHVGFSFAGTCTRVPSDSSVHSQKAPNLPFTHPLLRSLPDGQMLVKGPFDFKRSLCKHRGHCGSRIGASEKELCEEKHRNKQKQPLKSLLPGKESTLLQGVLFVGPHTSFDPVFSAASLKTNCLLEILSRTIAALKNKCRGEGKVQRCSEGRKELPQLSYKKTGRAHKVETQRKTVPRDKSC